MGKLATLPFVIGRTYEISQTYEVASLDYKTESKTNTQRFNVKTQYDLNLLNHHWMQLEAGAQISGIKVLPPYDITDDVVNHIKVRTAAKVKEIFKKDDILSDSKIKEYTAKIVKLLDSN